MWKSTEKMIRPIADTLSSNGIEITIHDLTTADLGNIAKDLVDSKAIVLGAPTVLGGAHPLAVQATYLVRALRPPTKFLVLISSHGWTGGAIKQIQEVLGASRIEVVGTLDTYGPPSENDIKQVIELGKTLAAKIKD
jgi:flavorubredoxin